MISAFDHPRQRVEHFREGDLVTLLRRRKKSGTFERALGVKCGPNVVHAAVIRADGSVEDKGLSRNLLTNIGRDVLDGAFGFIPAGFTTSTASPATATTATSLTVTGTPLTASNLATPQLGVAGMRIYVPVTGLTTPPVFGNIVSNTSSVITVDQWWTVNGSGSDQTGATPSSTAAFIITPGGLAACRYIAFSTNASAASASDTTLASEVTTNGMGRALGTYAHTFGATTLTLSKTFTASGTVSSIHKCGLFGCLTSAGADPCIFETVLSVDVSVASSDQVALTWTVTLSG